MRLYKQRLTRLLVFIIALQILNISIDPSGAGQYYSYTETANFNYIDSYIEYVTEVMLTYENAIPESAKSPQKQWPHKWREVICVNTPIAYNQSVFYVAEKELFPYHDDRYTYRFIKEIWPPPELSC